MTRIAKNRNMETNIEFILMMQEKNEEIYRDRNNTFQMEFAQFYTMEKNRHKYYNYTYLGDNKLLLHNFQVTNSTILYDLSTLEFSELKYNIHAIRFAILEEKILYIVSFNNKEKRCNLIVYDTLINDKIRLISLDIPTTTNYEHKLKYKDFIFLLDKNTIYRINLEDGVTRCIKYDWKQSEPKFFNVYDDRIFLLVQKLVVIDPITMNELEIDIDNQEEPLYMFNNIIISSERYKKSINFYEIDGISLKKISIRDIYIPISFTPFYLSKDRILLSLHHYNNSTNLVVNTKGEIITEIDYDRAIDQILRIDDYSFIFEDEYFFLMSNNKYDNIRMPKGTYFPIKTNILRFEISYIPKSIRNIIENLI